MKWVKTGKTVTKQCTTITYAAEGTGYTVESRKQQIPHTNGIGTWEFTSYVVQLDGADLAEKYSFKAAKQFAEQLMEGQTDAEVD